MIPFANPTPKILADWRGRMGFSQRDACAALGCSRNAWAGWESGDQAAPRYIGLACWALERGCDGKKN